MLRLLFMLTPVLLCLSPQPGKADKLEPGTISTAEMAMIDADVNAARERDAIIGIAIGVIQRGRIAYLKGYGLADREENIPVTTETVFGWASNSKPLAAVAALQLAEKSLLDIEADVRTYVPEFPDKGVSISTRQLLCHQSGLPHYEHGQVIPTIRANPGSPPFANPILALDKFSQSPLLFSPGEKFSYSGFGYILVSAVVERAGREAFVNQIQQQIAKPLEMTSLQLDVERTTQHNWAAGYEKNAKGEVVRIDRDDAEYWKYGAGGFKSNIVDFARWAEGLVNRRLVSAQTEKLMWTPQKATDGTVMDALGDRMGLGFFIGDDGGSPVVFHSGQGWGYSTLMVLYPREKHGLVMMCNCDWEAAALMAIAVAKKLSHE